MATDTRNGQRVVTARDIEEMLQERIRESGHDPDTIALLIQVKQARALEFIANTLRDGKLKIVEG